MLEITTIPQNIEIISPAPALDLAAPALAYLSGLNKRGRVVQLQALDKIAALLSAGKVLSCKCFPWYALRFEHTTALRTLLIDSYAPATVRRFISALKGVLKAAWRIGQMTADNFYRAVDIKAPLGEKLPAGRDLSDKEIGLLMAVCGCDPTPAGLRDSAILGVLYGCGLRREELATLTLGDYDVKQSRIKVHGKRNKERYVYPPEGAKMALNDWLVMRGDTPGGLFLALSNQGKILYRKLPITGQAVYYILLRRAKEAKIENITPHDLRRTFVGDLLEKGNDLSIVSKMVGHSNPQTTARYDRRPENSKRKAAESLTVNYTRRSEATTA